jgi:hypothetical protein
VIHRKPGWRTFGDVPDRDRDSRDADHVSGFLGQRPGEDDDEGACGEEQHEDERDADAQRNRLPHRPTLFHVPDDVRGSHKRGDIARRGPER